MERLMQDSSRQDLIDIIAESSFQPVQLNKYLIACIQPLRLVLGLPFFSAPEA
jgi:hypothetical protein